MEKIAIDTLWITQVFHRRFLPDYGFSRGFAAFSVDNLVDCVERLNIHDLNKKPGHLRKKAAFCLE